MKSIYCIFLSGILLSCSDNQPELAEQYNGEWLSIEKELQQQLILTPDSTVVHLPEGHYMFTKSLMIGDKTALTIKGKGADKTVLSFASQEEGAEGLKIANCNNIVLEDFTIEDAKGDNIKVTDTKGITFRHIISQWTGEPKEENGAYAFYPVLSKNVLIEDCIAIGASDAGIYVGQSDSVIIRNNEAYFNVAGIESENSKWVDIYGNYAHHNTGGILVFDLPGLTQYGFSTSVYENRVVSNNYRNFAPEGNIVATVPSGTGFMLLATRKIDIRKNKIYNNRTVGLAIASYDLVEAMSTPSESQLNENIEIAQKDELYDPYPSEIYIHDNEFRNAHWIPTLKNDFGLLFLTKFPFSTPDIVWDGIEGESTIKLCIQENGAVKMANLDAANDFAGLNTNDATYDCIGETIEHQLAL